MLDGREVATSREGDTYYIPLEEQEGEQETMQQMESQLSDKDGDELTRWDLAL